jgi:hypothetical protein
MTEQQKLAALSKLWLQAKAEEKEANLKRVAIEEEIVELVGAKEEGSISTECAGMKITCTGKLTYKADVLALQALTAGWPEDIQPVQVKYVADDTRLKKLRLYRQDLWKSIAPAVEVKPAKTGVTIVTTQE